MATVLSKSSQEGTGRREERRRWREN
jgi:hypothetical protein